MPNEGTQVGPHAGWVVLEAEGRSQISPPCRLRSEDRPRGDRVVDKPGGQLSPETTPAADLQPPDLGRGDVRYLSPQPRCLLRSPR